MLRAIQQLPTEPRRDAPRDGTTSSRSFRCRRADDGDHGSCTYAELDDRAARVAAGLCAAGLHAGDRLLALLPSGQELIELLLGCARSGMVLVP